MKKALMRGSDVSHSVSEFHLSPKGMTWQSRRFESSPVPTRFPNAPPVSNQHYQDLTSHQVMGRLELQFSSTSPTQTIKSS